MVVPLRAALHLPKDTDDRVAARVAVQRITRGLRKTSDRERADAAAAARASAAVCVAAALTQGRGSRAE